MNLKNQLGGYIGERAEYECEIYKYCNQKLVQFLRKNDIKDCLLKMLVNVIFAFLIEFKEYNCMNDFILLYNSKTNSGVITGAIDIDKFIADLNAIDSYKEKITYMLENFNIRISLTFLDMIFKFFLSKKIEGTEYIEEVSRFFDDNVRNRLATEPKSIGNDDEYIPRDEMRINNFITPHGSLIRADERCRKKNGIKLECCKMVDLIEPYKKLEKDKYNKDRIEKDFNVGSNLFTDSTIYAGENDVDTVDVFGAGLSGHTTDIILLFSIFTELNDIDKYLLIIGCLIWMLNFYHHSLREIVLVGTIFMIDDTLAKEALKLFMKSIRQEYIQKLSNIRQIKKVEKHNNKYQ
jgi:hypothetical protein